MAGDLTKASERAHELYKQIVDAVELMDDCFELVSRTVYEFVKNPELCDVMGFESPMDIFRQPEIARHLDRMKINSRTQFYRWKELAAIDSIEPKLGVLRLENLSTITQSSKIKRIRELVETPVPFETKQLLLDQIITGEIGQDEPRKEEFELRENEGYFNGKLAIRFLDDGVLGVRAKSQMMHLANTGMIYYEDTNTLMGFRGDDGKKIAIVATKDPDFLDYMKKRLRCQFK